MTSKASFSEQEWTLVQRAPHLAGAVIPMLDFGLVSITKETRAIIKALDAARQRHRKDAFMTEALALQDMPEIEKTDKLEQQVPAILEQIRGAVAAVRAKASPSQVQAYCSVVYAVAETAASASGSGWFGTGDKISDKEKAYLSELERILEG